MMTHLSSSVTFFVCKEPRRAGGTPRHPMPLLPPASAAGLHLNPAFFRPSHCRHPSCGSVRGEKMRPPHTTDDIQRRSSARTLSWRLPEVLGSPQRTSIRAGCDSSQSLFTAYARRRSGETWKEPTYLTLGFHKKHQFILRRLHQVDASKTLESSGISMSSLSYLRYHTTLEAADQAAAVSCGPVRRPCFQVTVSAPAGA
jgi:hypothetical protein